MVGFVGIAIQVHLKCLKRQILTQFLAITEHVADGLLTAVDSNFAAWSLNMLYGRGIEPLSEKWLDGGIEEPGRLCFVGYGNIDF